MSVRDTIRKQRLTVVEHPIGDGESVWLRALSGPGRVAYRDYVEKARANGGVRAEAVAAMAICEPDGTLVYDYNNPEDLQELVDHIDGHVLDDIGVRLFEISGLTERSREEAAKN